MAKYIRMTLDDGYLFMRADYIVAVDKNSTDTVDVHFTGGGKITVSPDTAGNATQLNSIVNKTNQAIDEAYKDEFTPSPSRQFHVNIGGGNASSVTFGEG